MIPGADVVPYIRRLAEAPKIKANTTLFDAFFRAYDGQDLYLSGHGSPTIPLFLTLPYYTFHFAFLTRMKRVEDALEPESTLFRFDSQSMTAHDCAHIVTMLNAYIDLVGADGQGFDLDELPLPDTCSGLFLIGFRRGDFLPFAFVHRDLTPPQACVTFQLALADFLRRVREGEVDVS